MRHPNGELRLNVPNTNRRKKEASIVPGQPVLINAGTLRGCAGTVMLAREGGRLLIAMSELMPRVLVEIDADVVEPLE